MNSGREITPLRQVTKDVFWKAQVFGDPNGSSWEISVVRSDNELGQRSWGWFNERKLLVSHNGGPCNWPLAKGLGDKMVLIANQLAIELNKETY